MVIELAGDDFVGDLSDQIASFLVQKLELDVRHRCRFFKDAESLDKFSRHRVPPRSSLDILERPLCLRAAVPARWDGNFTHSIFLDSSLSHSDAPFFCSAFFRMREQNRLQSFR